MTMNDENAVVISESQAVIPVETSNDILAYGEMIAKSGMFGACTPAKGAVIFMISKQEDMSILEIKQNLHITNNGDIQVRADAALAKFIRRGGKCEWIDFSNEKAEAAFSSKHHNTITISYTIEDAKRSGLLDKDVWKKNTDAMLRSRLIMKALRMIDPECVAGTYAQEELPYESQEPQTPPQPVENPEDRVKAATGSKAIGDNGKKTSAKSQPKPHIDYTICPVEGKLKGVPWSDMDSDTLQVVVETDHPDMENEHYETVKEILQERGGAK